MKKKLGILGSGYLAEVIANAWKDGFLEDYELVGIMGRNRETADSLAERMRCRSCATVEELLELKPDYVAEAAGVSLIKEHAAQILSSGSSLIVLSIGAFASEEFYSQIRETAAASGARVYLASGAVGGFDVLRTVSLMGQVKAGITTKKGPGSLRNTPLFTESLMTDAGESHVFEGNAKEAIRLLPTKVNVAVASSLATAGPDNTSVNIYSVPGMVGDDHCIIAEVDGVRAVVDIYSSTSEIAGWSVVAVLQNIVSPIVF